MPIATQHGVIPPSYLEREDIQQLLSFPAQLEAVCVNKTSSCEKRLQAVKRNTAEDRQLLAKLVNNEMLTILAYFCIVQTRNCAFVMNASWQLCNSALLNLPPYTLGQVLVGVPAPWSLWDSGQTREDAVSVRFTMDIFFLFQLILQFVCSFYLQLSKLILYPVFISFALVCILNYLHFLYLIIMYITAPKTARQIHCLCKITWQ